MPSDTTGVKPPEVSTMPGSEVIVPVRRLIITALVAAIGYSMFSTASRARCPGGVSSDGGFIDEFGKSTEVAPSCISMTLHPSPLVYLVLALIVVWAVTRIARGRDEATVLRVLSWTGPTVILVTILAIVLSRAAFSSIPIEYWDGTSDLPVPGWLHVDVVIAPMEGA